MPVLLLTHVSTSTSLCACLWYEHHYSFLCIWGCKPNVIGWVQTTFTIPVIYIRGRMLGSDLTLWPPNQIMSVHWDTTGQTTLEDHWSHTYTGMPLEPHWLMLAPSGVPVAISVNLHNWNTLEDHWSHKYTGMPLEPHRLMLAPSGVPVLICIIGTHWKTTGKPLEDHWKHTGISSVAFQCTLGSKFQAHWIATWLPLEDHWLRVRVGNHALYYPSHSPSILAAL